MNFSRSYVLKSGVHYKDDNVLMNVISNINWSEWSTIQGVIARVISKSDDRTPSARPISNYEHDYSLIVRHEVQLLINCIYNKFRN